MRIVSQKDIDRFLSYLDRREMNMHSILIWQNGKMLREEYYAPFTKDMTHRMYSVTKSFVSIAVGCLVGDGKIGLDDPIVKYFPDKLPEELPREMREQTVRNMLEMRTCLSGVNWFRPGVTDRLAYYFSQKPVRPAGTLFDYDSTGSYVLGCLAERVSGMPLLDFMKQRFLNEIGGFENARILATPDGTPWGDSAMICTPRALMNFALLVKNGGEWNGKQLLPKDYVEMATTRRSDNDLEGTEANKHHGYGWQFWMEEDGGWRMDGMGAQFAVCLPKDDLVIVTTGDLQYDSMGTAKLLRFIQDVLLNGYAEEPHEVKREIRAAAGERSSPMEREINGAVFKCEENDMGIKDISFLFDEDGLTLRYTNAQGEKELRAGRGRNKESLFPEYGYSSDRGNVHEMTDFRYRCQTSFAWRDSDKLRVLVQITDDYFGSCVMTFGFRDKDTLGIRMVSVAEDFLQTYRGWGNARRA